MLYLPSLTLGLLTQKLDLTPEYQAEPFFPGPVAIAPGTDSYAVNEEPQPQLPVAFGFLKVKPDPITLVT